MRLNSVDALRGLVMILMALDHTRDYFHADALLFPPEDLSRTTGAIFFTRWITHICAPTFLFTAGLGAFLRWKRGSKLDELAPFLWKRGVWLMALEITALRLAYNFSLFSGPVVLTVLWVIGLSMIVLAFLVRLPVRALAILSIAMIALHNLTDRVVVAQVFGSAAWLWNVLHQPGLFQVGDAAVIVAYPLIPWVAVMMAGFCFGHVLAIDDAERRRQWLLRIGLIVTAAFFVVRGLNIYGDPFPWTSRIPGMTVASFLRCAKYPPSLSFLLMTLGPAILLLRWFDAANFSKTNPLIVFGRVPLFYFLGHLFAIHGLAVLFALVRHGHAGFLFGPLPTSGGAPYPQGYGYDLWFVYVVWIVIVALMYPLCRWFMRVRERRRDWWLSYL